jgi:hypothetical protein
MDPTVDPHGPIWIDKYFATASGRNLNGIPNGPIWIQFGYIDHIFEHIRLVKTDGSCILRMDPVFCEWSQKQRFCNTLQPVWIHFPQGNGVFFQRLDGSEWIQMDHSPK